jgi:hypothetical protein
MHPAPRHRQLRRITGRSALLIRRGYPTSRWNDCPATHNIVPGSESLARHRSKHSITLFRLQHAGYPPRLRLVILIVHIPPPAHSYHPYAVLQKRWVIVRGVGGGTDKTGNA